MRWGQRAEWRKRGMGHNEQPMHSSTSHSCPHLVTIHTIPTPESLTFTHTHTHTQKSSNDLLSLMSRHICEHQNLKTLIQRFLLPPEHTNTHRKHVRLNTHYLLSSLSCQASLHNRGSGDTVGWLKVFRAVLLLWWLSTVVCSHVLQGKPDLNIYERLTQRNRK